MAKKSRDKGARGEREVAELLRSIGLQAHRGQQFKGTKDSPDVITNWEGVLVESKLRETWNISKWMDEAQQDSPMDNPVLFVRKNNGKWIVCVYAEDLVEVARSLIKSIASSS